MTLSRRDLEEGRMRAVYVEALDRHRALSDDALAASLAAALARRPAYADWWVFAYGSLLWNPLFPFIEARPATLRGKHRRFCLWSLASRGTTRHPGLVLGLDQGGSCHGVVYRLPAECASAELALLWRREMVVGAYHPRWLRVRAGSHALTALAFVLILGRAERFQCGKQIASYLGLVPLEDSSGNRRRLGHITKQGNSLLRFLLVEAAQVTVRSLPEWRSKYVHLTMRRE
jgi:cation transport protein ChaC